MFDILVLLGLGIISGLGVNTAFKSHVHFKKTQAFAEMHLRIMEENRLSLENITKEIKAISKNYRDSMAEIESPIIPCVKFKSGECALCGGTGNCLLKDIKVNTETMATRPQKKGMVGL